MSPAPTMAPRVMSFDSRRRLNGFRFDAATGGRTDAGTAFCGREVPRGGLTGRSDLGFFGAFVLLVDSAIGCAAGGAGGAEARSRASNSRRVRGAEPAVCIAAGAGAEAGAGAGAGGASWDVNPRAAKSLPESAVEGFSVGAEPKSQLNSVTGYQWALPERMGRVTMRAACSIDDMS